MEEGRDSKGSLEGVLSHDEAREEALRCLLCDDAPCRRDCPAGIDVRGFIRRIRFEDPLGAALLILSENLFGGTCGRLCPAEVLCRKECSRRLLGRPVEIARLQTYAVEMGFLKGLPPLDLPPFNGKRVAVVGGGPAGIQCALSLRLKGYGVTLFEKEALIGGIPATCIPAYRLPLPALQKELHLAEESGIDFRTRTPVDTTGVRDLKDQGFQAIFFSSGLTKGVELDTEGMESRGIEVALDFLKRVKDSTISGRGVNRLDGERVVVIGGGGVAMDAGMVAKGLGAEEVTLLSLESFLEMPAFRREKDEALAMGLGFIGRVMVDRVVSEGGNVSAVEGHFIRWREPEWFVPENAVRAEGSFLRLAAERVIVAIGQRAEGDLAGLLEGQSGDGDAVELSSMGEPFPVPVFAGGDLVNRMKTVVHAVASGKTAAGKIDESLAPIGSRSGG